MQKYERYFEEKGDYYAHFHQDPLPAGLVSDGARDLTRIEHFGLPHADPIMPAKERVP